MLQTACQPEAPRVSMQNNGYWRLHFEAGFFFNNHYFEICNVSVFLFYLSTRQNINAKIKKEIYRESPVNHLKNKQAMHVRKVYSD